MPASSLHLGIFSLGPQLLSSQPSHVGPVDDDDDDVLAVEYYTTLSFGLGGKRVEPRYLYRLLLVLRVSFGAGISEWGKDGKGAKFFHNPVRDRGR